MERKRAEPTLMDGYMADLGDPKMAAKLDQLDRTIPWEKLTSPIRATYDNDGVQGGRPNVSGGGGGHVEDCHVAKMV